MIHGPFKRKYVSEEETPFVKHAFLQQQDGDISAIEPEDETKESIA
jgi:hypothetical protein